MKQPSAIVLMFPGTNCHMETSFGLSSAGFKVTRAHVNELLRGEKNLDEYQLLAVPGGFSYGDDIASGKVAANKLAFKLGEQVKDFAKDNLVIGICNGFQILVKAGLIPAINGDFDIQATLTYNDIGHYYCNWVRLKNVNKGKCIFTKGIEQIEFPVAHGEGKFAIRDAESLKRIEENDQVVFKYVAPDGKPANGYFPYNTSNTVKDITGVCNETGRILGMMPHPERYLCKENHPRWTSGEGSDTYNGRIIFKNAFEYARDHLV
nr:phosphoribosylformylglycinamidine synthase I [Candidatus Sigynarchaeota archaeon]